MFRILPTHYVHASKFPDLESYVIKNWSKFIKKTSSIYFLTIKETKMFKIVRIDNCMYFMAGER